MESQFVLADYSTQPKNPDAYSPPSLEEQYLKDWALYMTPEHQNLRRTPLDMFRG